MKDTKVKKNFRLEPEVESELEAAARETGLSQTAIVQLLIRNWRKLLK